MTKINGGATLWARKTLNSDIFFNKPDKWFKIWFYFINKVNHKDNKQFARGSCFMKYEWIMEKTKATKNEVDHCIRWLKSATMITTRKATRGFIIKVNNYNGYQRLENYKSDSKSDSKSDLKAKQKRNKSDTINKNGKYDIYDKKKKEKISFNFIKKEFINLTKEKMEEFDEKYAKVDIDQEIERMENWLMKEKEKRDNGEKNKIPKDYNRFINNWLRKEEQ